MLHHLPIKKKYRITVFYVLALTLYFVLFGEDVLRFFAYPESFIAPIMALGSFVAGSTFLGGGAVAFPALTKLLHTDPITAKTFSLAIQSVGMTSASLYILARVKYVSTKFMMVYIGAATPGILFSLTVLEQAIYPTDLRIGFTLFIFCFLCVYLWTLKMKLKGKSKPKLKHTPEILLVVISGFIGGLISGLLGSGADLVAFSVLALYFRTNIKLATQTSVIIMAAMSIIGIFIQGPVLNKIPDYVTPLWLIAAPVVMIGAPLGAMFCRRVAPERLRIFILAIIFIEITTTFALIPIEIYRLPYYICVFVVSLSYLLYLKYSSHRKHS